MLDILRSMDTTFIQMLGLHLLLLHLEKGSLDHSRLMEQQDPPSQLHSHLLLLQFMDLILLELQGLPLWHHCTHLSQKLLIPQ